MLLFNSLSVNIIYIIKHGDMIMKIYYISDIHLEFFLDKNNQLIKNSVVSNLLDLVYLPILSSVENTDDENILLLAGDICTGKYFHFFIPLFEKALLVGNYQKIFMIAGNHEYYHSDFLKAPLAIKTAISNSPILKNKMFYIDNENIVLNNHVNLIASTLWYKVPAHFELKITDELNDYVYIMKSNKNIGAIGRGYSYNQHEHTLIDYPFIYQKYVDSINFIKNSLIQNNKTNLKSIVMTHHALSERFMIGTIYEDNPDNVYGYGTVMPYDFLDEKVNIEEYSIWTHSKCLACGKEYESKMVESGFGQKVIWNDYRK